jgi:hypothetical protein
MSDATRPDLKQEDVEALIDYLGQVGSMVESPRHISTARAMKARIEALEVALTWIKKKSVDKRNPSISFVAEKVLRGEQFSPLRREFADRIVEKLEGDAIAEAVTKEREECAKVCETTLWYGGTGDYPGKHMASLIRARSATKREG